MSSKSLLLVLLVFSSLSLALTVPGENYNCDNDEGDICRENVGFVHYRRLKGDYSVAFSHYMQVNQTDFVKAVTMTELSYSGTIVTAERHQDPADLVLSHVTDSNLEAALSTSLGSMDTFSSERATNYYVAYAAIDLMNYKYTQLEKDTTGKLWKFSAQQLVDEMRQLVLSDDSVEKIHEYNIISRVMDYLTTKGVCEEAQYEANIGCTRYMIESAERLNDQYTNQYVLDNIAKDPIYIQIGLHPMYYQFYSPSAEDPIHAGYTRPSYAGVLTGYNLETKGEEYWEMYIRRHGDNYNKVKVACKFEKDGEPQLPFGGLSSKMYQMNVSLKPVDRVELKLDLNNNQVITTTEGFKNLINTNTIQTDIPTVVLYTDLFDCSAAVQAGETINIAEVFTSMTSIIFVGEDMDYMDCLDFFADTLEEIIDMTPEEYEGTTTRRLEEVDYSTIDAMATKTLKFEGKSLVSIKYGNNKYNTYKYSLIIKDCPRLTNLYIGDESFIYGPSISLINNELLSTITIGSYSFGRRPAMPSAAAEFHDLPALEFVDLGEHAMDNMSTASIQNINPEEEGSVEIHGENAFSYLSDYTSSGNVGPSFKDFFDLKAGVATTSPSQEPSV